MLCTSLKNTSESVLELAYKPSISNVTKSGVPPLGTNSSEFIYVDRDLKVLVTFQTEFWIPASRHHLKSSSITIKYFTDISQVLNSG